MSWGERDTVRRMEFIADSLCLVQDWLCPFIQVVIYPHQNFEVQSIAIIF